MIPRDRATVIASLLNNKRPLIALVAAQLLCLAFGLWIQDRLVQAAARYVAASAAPDEMPTAQLTTASAAPPDSSAPAESALLPHNMLVVRILTWFWIGGLQAGLAVLVLTRIFSDSSQARQQSLEEVVRRSRDLVKTRNAIIFGLAKLADYRDNETGQHLERIALYVTQLATAARRHPNFRNAIDVNFIKNIGISSALHDIGKVSIEDAILRKPGKLESPERERMQEHTRIGAECIREIEVRLGTCNFLQMSRQIAEFHHERWDGSGYSSGLAGEAIPLAARVVAIADVYDALSVRRVYKEAFPHTTCVEIIRRGAGTQFDPNLVEVFLSIEHEFRDIALRFGGKPVPTGFTRPCDSRRENSRRQANLKLLNTIIEPDIAPNPAVTGVA